MAASGEVGEAKTKAIIKLQDKDADSEQQNTFRQIIIDEIAQKYPTVQLESQA